MVSKYKTKFPMARIKKIMQMDEEVGKVAQATPIVISKALELFLQRLINRASKELNPGVCRISNSILKRTIKNTEEFDFLKELVKDLPDEEVLNSRQATPSKRQRNAETISSGDETLTEDDESETRRMTAGKSKMKISALISSENDD